MTILFKKLYYIFSEAIIPDRLWVMTKITAGLIWQNNSPRNDVSDAVVTCLCLRFFETIKNE